MLGNPKFISCPPCPPTLGGDRMLIRVKSPPELGDLGGELTSFFSTLIINNFP